MPKRRLREVTPEQVTRLWFARQGLSEPRGSQRLTPESLTRHLEVTGALQLDSINVLDRAHYLTLWSRFGSYDRSQLDKWVYDNRLAYEYWGHEASILPRSHLPIGKRRMRRFPPQSWKNSSWWQRYQAPLSSRRRVLRRLRAEGPLESADFARTAEEGRCGPSDEMMAYPKEDKRALQMLWHSGSVAVRSRVHFRRTYDLADRIYPDGAVASLTEYQDSWLLQGLSGNGVASEAHLMNYITGPNLNARERARVLQRALKTGRIEQVTVSGHSDGFYALPEHLEAIDTVPEPVGTTLLCPFDSLLWQRCRAEEFLGFRYRIEIYVPRAKRIFGYYVLPIAHNGKLVGRLDPKCHRKERTLEIKALYLEPDFKPTAAFKHELAQTLRSLAEFMSCADIQLPRGWRNIL